MTGQFRQTKWCNIQYASQQQLLWVDSCKEYPSYKYHQSVKQSVRQDNNLTLNQNGASSRSCEKNSPVQHLFPALDIETEVGKGQRSRVAIAGQEIPRPLILHLLPLLPLLPAPLALLIAGPHQQRCRRDQSIKSLTASDSCRTRVRKRHSVFQFVTKLNDSRPFPSRLTTAKCFEAPEYSGSANSKHCSEQRQGWVT